MATLTQVAQQRARNHTEFWRQRRLIEDLVGPFSQWPHAIHRIFFTKLKPTNRDRFAMTVFFLCNGLDPILLKEYYDIAYIFDAEAKRHIDYIIKKYPTSKWTAWNIAMGRSM